MRSEPLKSFHGPSSPNGVIRAVTSCRKRALSVAWSSPNTSFSAQQILAGRRLPQVEDNRFLVTVVVPEEQRALEARSVVEKRPDPPRGIAFGRLDLDDFG